MELHLSKMENRIRQLNVAGAKVPAFLFAYKKNGKSIEQRREKAFIYKKNCDFFIDKYGFL